MERVFATNESDDMVLVILVESDQQHPCGGIPFGSGAWGLETCGPFAY
jgi:hypothetical protein